VADLPAGEGGRAPGRDEIVVTAAEGRHLCFSREHRAVGRLADVIVAFGQLGTRFTDELWHEAWGRAIPMCAACWEDTRRIAEALRPGLTVRGPGEHASGGGGGRGSGPGPRPGLRG
jgi:hypothetical protein